MEGNGIIKQNPEEAYLTQMQMMQGIVREMKEIPELPSEIPTDQAILERVEFPPEGGMVTYMSGHDYPYRGFPYFEIVEKIDLIKKISRASISGLYHSLKKKRWWLFTLIPAIWMVKDFVQVGVYTFYRMVERFRLKPIRYCKAIRELYRAFSIPRNEDLKTQETRLMLRDLICMVLEFDNAYRFRVQDWIEDLDQIAIKKNPIKEINRVLTIAQGRELTQEIKDTWKLAKLGVAVYLRFNKKLKLMLGDVLSSINKSEFRLMPEDKHFTTRRKDYVFKWIANPSREDKLILGLNEISLEAEKEEKELKQKHFNEHKLLDEKYTQELAQISSQVSEEEYKVRVETTEEKLLNLQKEFGERELAILNAYKSPEQIQLALTQAKEREGIKILQQKESDELKLKYEVAKNNLREEYK